MQEKAADLGLLIFVYLHDQIQGEVGVTPHLGYAINTK